MRIIYESAHSRVCVAFGQAANQLFKHLQIQPVVGVDKADHFTGATVQAFISGCRDASVRFMNHTNPGVFLRIFVTDLAAAVRRTVIDKDDLKLFVSL